MLSVIYRILLNILEWFFLGGYSLGIMQCSGIVFNVRVTEGAAQQSRYFMFCSLPFNLRGKFFDRSKFPLCCTTDQFTSRGWRGERLPSFCLLTKTSSNLPPCLFFKENNTKHSTLNIQMCVNGNTEY